MIAIHFFEILYINIYIYNSGGYIYIVYFTGILVSLFFLNVNHDKTSVFENTPAHTPPSLSLARYFEQVCGSGHKQHFPLTILARNGSIGSAPNGASGSATKSRHCVGMYGAASPLPSQHETSSPLGCGFVPSVVPHAHRMPEGVPAGSDDRSTSMVPRGPRQR